MRVWVLDFVSLSLSHSVCFNFRFFFFARGKAFSSHCSYKASESVAQFEPILHTEEEGESRTKNKSDAPQNKTKKKIVMRHFARESNQIFPFVIFSLSLSLFPSFVKLKSKLQSLAMFTQNPTNCCSTLSTLSLPPTSSPLPPQPRTSWRQKLSLSNQFWLQYESVIFTRSRCDSFGCTVNTSLLYFPYFFYVFSNRGVSK